MSRLVTLGALLTFAAIPAQGQELIFGANVGARWDSNVNNVPNGQSDFSARVGPEVRLLETQGELTYDFNYVPTYQAYSRFGGLDDWDQLVNSSITYQLGPATVLAVKDIFDYAPVASNFLQQLTTPAGVPLGTQTVNALGHYNVLINTASIDLQHSWTELWRGEASLTNFYYDPKIQDGITSNVSTGTANLTYAITPVDAVGGSLGATAQQFGSNSIQGSVTNYYYNASGIWKHEFSPTWSLDMSAGPTYVKFPAPVIPSTITLNSGPFLSVSPVSIANNALYALSPPASPINACTTTKLPNGLTVLNQCNGVPTLLLNSTSLPPGGLLTVTAPSANELAAASVPVQGLSSGSNSSLTYFANIQMTKRFETVTANLGYSRSAGGSSIGTSNTEVDTVNGSLVWTATPLWTTSLSVIWNDQGSTANNTAAIRSIVTPFQYSAKGLLAASALTPEITGILFQQQASTIHIYQWIVGLHSQYQLTKRLSIFGNFFFINQTASEQATQQGINLSSLNLNSTRIDLGFHYEFDPIHL